MPRTHRAASRPVGWHHWIGYGLFGCLVGWGYSAFAQPPASEPSPEVSFTLRLQNPQATVETFLDLMHQDELDQAAECLDLSELSTESRSAASSRLAFQLKATLDRMWHIRIAELPADGDTESPFILGAQASELQGADYIDARRIRLARDEDGVWRFSSATVAAIPDLYERWSSRPRIASLMSPPSRRPFQVWLADQFPDAWRHHKTFLLNDYQWISLVVLIFLGLLADQMVRALLGRLTRAWARRTEAELPTASERDIWRPIGLLANACVWYFGTRAIDLHPAILTVLLVGLKLCAVVAAVWTAFRIIDLISGYFLKKAEATASKFDDLLVPLISKSLKVFVICVGLLTGAQALDLPIAGLVGGLGLGGLALAMASRDAIANLFGSLTVLVDRPFEIGDWIITENAEGSVESVGFRSSRIRTFYNSQITLPNSLLTSAIVDNMGRRRYRRIKTVIGVQYNTPPAQIEAFCEGIRELIRRHPYTRKDYYHVYLNNFSASSLDILLYCFVECPDWSIELRERHRLLADIIRLADQLHVSFAFPTSTVHLFSEQPPGSPPELAEPLAIGRQTAAHITGEPFSRTNRPGSVEF